MRKYKFKYWFEWGCSENVCPCLWSNDNFTNEKFGYVVDINSLPISEELKAFIFSLGIRHDEALDWDYPPDPLLWTAEEATQWYCDAHNAHKRLIEELGEDYDIEYCECE